MYGTRDVTIFKKRYPKIIVYKNQDPVSASFSKISTRYQEANYALTELFFIPLINWLFQHSAERNSVHL